MQLFYEGFRKRFRMEQRWNLRQLGSLDEARAQMLRVSHGRLLLLRR